MVVAVVAVVPCGVGVIVVFAAVLLYKNTSTSVRHWCTFAFCELTDDVPLPLNHAPPPSAGFQSSIYSAVSRADHELHQATRVWESVDEIGLSNASPPFEQRRARPAEV